MVIFFSYFCFLKKNKLKNRLSGKGEGNAVKVKFESQLKKKTQIMQKGSYSNSRL